MPSRIQCFWLEPTDQVEISLRRYAAEGRGRCPAARAPYEGRAAEVWGFHSEIAVIDIRPSREDDVNREATPEEHANPGWPKKCACGYVFADDDHWQRNTHTLYMRTDEPAYHTLFNAPVGAMWNAPWYEGHNGPCPRPDTLYLVVRTPAGDWLIDGPATGGGGWTRAGKPPLINVTPSIAMGEPRQLHGWLRNGVLEIDFP